MNIKEYLEKIRELVKGSENAKGFYSFIIEKGKEFKGSAIENKKVLDWIKLMKPQRKGCYYNAQLLALAVKGLKYFEGWAYTKMGFPLEHSWLIDKKNKVIDVTWCDGVEYFGVEIPVDFVKKEMYETGYSNSLLNRYYLEKII